jgi:hypothetical protein
MTFGNAAAARVRLIVWCKACGHRVEPDAAGMAARSGAKTAVPEWRAHGSEKSVHPLHVRAIDDFFIVIVEYLYVAPKKIADFQKRLEALRGIEDEEAGNI